MDINLLLMILNKFLMVLLHVDCTLKAQLCNHYLLNTKANIF